MARFNVQSAAQVFSAAAVAALLTCVMSWSFVDSTRVAHWLSPADVLQARAEVRHAAAGKRLVLADRAGRTILL
jgi:hypothetical protein